jgi:hypothetical protein
MISRENDCRSYNYSSSSTSNYKKPKKKKTTEINPNFASPKKSFIFKVIYGHILCLCKNRAH